ncbi:MAG: hypothetical protein RIG84_07345 [Roseovarius sp.]
MTRNAPEAPEIKTRPDGSIDTAHYMQRGRHMRSEQAHAMMGGLLGHRRDQRQRRRAGWVSALF